MELVFDWTDDNPSRPGEVADWECRRLSDLLGGFQGFVGHELPNQLVPIQAFARLLLEQHASQLDEEARLLLTRLAALTQRADQQARGLEEIGRLPREPAWGPPVSLTDVVREAVAEVKSAPEVRAANSSKIFYHVGEEMPSVPLSRRLLHQVLVQLLRNATQAIPADRTGRIEITAEGLEGWRLIVRDNGRGLPSTSGKQALLEPFAAGRRPGAIGPGLGLYLVSQAIAKWRGRLEVWSELGRGSAFTLFIRPSAPSCCAGESQGRFMRE